VEKLNRRNVTETDGFLPLSKACSSIIKILYPTEWNIDDTLNYRVNDEKKMF
jgi:hypothetical protein